MAFDASYLKLGLALFPLAGATWWYWNCSSRSNRRLPPGPSGWPLIGNLLDMPQRLEWKVFQQWCRDFNSDIIHLSVAGKSIIVIDKYETAMELLNKRAAIYSNRPDMPMMKLMGDWQSFNIPFMVYGDSWRKSRRQFHQLIREQTTPRYLPLIQKGAVQFLQRVLDNPEEFISHIHLMTSSIAIQIAYGLDVQSHDDSRLVLLQSVVEAIKACQPGEFFVNVFPCLKYLPQWFPGGGFKRYATKWAKLTKEAVQGTYQIALENISQGNETPSLVMDAIQAAGMENLTEKDEYEISATAFSMYGAAYDTTAATIATFILLMTLNRSVQLKAQEEISSQCSPGALPSFEENESYPYLTATVLELLRWAPAGPSGLPHVLEADDIYNGYSIPSGSIIIANIWSMLRNEDIYPDPEAFQPERFLKDGGINTDILNPLDVTFGFGRRLCPGRLMAFAALWTAVASILATFDILLPEDGTEPVPEFTPAVVLHPVPFKCRIKVQSEEATSLIRSLNLAL